MHTTIVIPTYNEAGNIGRLVEQIRATVPDVYILVVDDNSPDGTGKIVQEIFVGDAQVQLFARKEKEGLGAAYLAAFKRVLAEGSTDTIVMMDADYSHDPKYLPEILKQREKYDVVLGSRYISGGSTVGWELWRRALSYWGNTYARFVAGLPIRDCTGGFNAISTARLGELDLDSIQATGYAFIMGLKFRLAQTGATFSEVPIIFHNRREGESKMSSASLVRYFNEGVLAPWRMRWSNFRKV